MDLCPIVVEANDRSAVRLAPALASLREPSVQLDVPAVQEAPAEMIRGVGEVQGMKGRLTFPPGPMAQH